MKRWKLISWNPGDKYGIHVILKKKWNTGIIQLWIPYISYFFLIYDFCGYFICICFSVDSYDNLWTNHCIFEYIKHSKIELAKYILQVLVISIYQRDRIVLCPAQYIEYVQVFRYLTLSIKFLLHYCDYEVTTN